MLLHVAHAARNGHHKIMIQTVDTDVVVLAVAVVGFRNWKEFLSYSALPSVSVKASVKSPPCYRPEAGLSPNSKLIDCQDTMGGVDVIWPSKTPFGSFIPPHWRCAQCVS